MTFQVHCHHHQGDLKNALLIFEIISFLGFYSKILPSLSFSRFLFHLFSIPVFWQYTSPSIPLLMWFLISSKILNHLLNKNSKLWVDEDTMQALWSTTSSCLEHNWTMKAETVVTERLFDWDIWPLLAAPGSRAASRAQRYPCHQQGCKMGWRPRPAPASYAGSGSLRDLLTRSHSETGITQNGVCADLTKWTL